MATHLLRPAVALFGALVGVLGLAPVGAAAPAQEGPGSSSLTASSGGYSAAELVPEPSQINPALLANVTITSPEVRSLTARLSTAHQSLTDGQLRILGEVAETERLDGEIGRATSELNRAVVVKRRADRELQAASGALEDYAITTFVGTGDLALEPTMNQGRPDRTPVLTADTEVVVLARHDDAVAVLADAVANVATLDTELAGLKADRVASIERRAQAERDVANADATINELTPALDEALALSSIQGFDQPLVVVDAYFQAAVTMYDMRPSCRVTWNQLAAIGQVESHHGTYRGSVVDATGQTSGTIIGPPLDGVVFQSIPDTDGGAYDHDPVWDRAVGPMQFIPSSWKAYGLDGNGDGVVDPHNMYDAALAAAEHLCRTHDDLQNEANYGAALLGYNRSEVYGAQVRSLADRYQASLPLPPPWELPSPEADPNT